MNFSLNVNNQLLNKLFPFHILINEKTELVSIGNSIKKMSSILEGNLFVNAIEITRPYTVINSFEDIKKLENQLIFFQTKCDSKILLRGQFEFLEDKNEVLFIGTPWFNSVDEVVQKHLVLSDFAIHDPLIDLLHVIKTSEMASEDLKHLIKTIDNQKKELKKATKEVEDIALFPKQNPDPLIRVNFNGDVLLRNPASDKFTYLIYKGIKYDCHDAWHNILKDIDTSQNKNEIEALFDDKVYSFIIVKLQEQEYYNIYGRDITNQKKYETELKKLSLVADKTTNAVIITDGEGRIEWANQAFENATGYQLEEVMNLKPGNFLQGKDTDPTTVDFIRENLKKEINFSAEILNYTKKGKPYWIKMNFQPIKDELGNLVQFFSIQDDVTIQKKTQELLTRKEEKYRSIISNVNLGLLEVDLEERILMANQSFCDMSGYTQKELYGQIASKLFAPVDNSDVFNKKNDLRKNKVSDAYEIQVKLKNQQNRHWLISGAPLINDNGEIIGSIGIHLDITERKEQEKKMEELLATLQIVNQELNDFAYIVSHDLKAPLRAIGSLATWLENDYSEKLDEEGKETLQLMVQRTQRMNNLIDGVLKYSKVGRTQDERKEIQTNNFVEKIIDLLAPPSNIKITIEKELPNVFFEETKLQQVIQNLISNAIKFMNKSEGKISIDYQEFDDEFQFSVSDNGPGIEQQYYDKIFQIFQTLNARDSVESTGVGLSIVKKIVENFGGKIWLTSNYGEGTTFYFTIKK